MAYPLFLWMVLRENHLEIWDLSIAMMGFVRFLLLLGIHWKISPHGISS